jgi:hypothetical protein
MCFCKLQQSIRMQVKLNQDFTQHVSNDTQRRDVFIVWVKFFNLLTTYIFYINVNSSYMIKINVTFGAIRAIRTFVNNNFLIVIVFL